VLLPCNYIQMGYFRCKSRVLRTRLKAVCSKHLITARVQPSPSRRRRLNQPFPMGNYPGTANRPLSLRCLSSQCHASSSEDVLRSDHRPVDHVRLCGIGRGPVTRMGKEISLVSCITCNSTSTHGSSLDILNRCAYVTPLAWRSSTYNTRSVSLFCLPLWLCDGHGGKHVCADQSCNDHRQDPGR
jgi:hypothetical protein